MPDSCSVTDFHIQTKIQKIHTNCASLISRTELRSICEELQWVKDFLLLHI